MRCGSCRMAARVSAQSYRHRHRQGSVRDGPEGTAGHRRAVRQAASARPTGAAARCRSRALHRAAADGHAGGSLLHGPGAPGAGAGAGQPAEPGAGTRAPSGAEAGRRRRQLSRQPVRRGHRGASGAGAAAVDRPPAAGPHPPAISPARHGRRGIALGAADGRRLSCRRHADGGGRGRRHAGGRCPVPCLLRRSVRGERAGQRRGLDGPGSRAGAGGPGGELGRAHAARAGPPARLWLRRSRLRRRRRRRQLRRLGPGPAADRPCGLAYNACSDAAGEGGAMDDAGKLLIGKGEQQQFLYLPVANRHGLVAGATGTGKTITLQVLAEGFSRARVPGFCADVKGDLSGIAEAGAANPKLAQRAAELGETDYASAAAPVIFWDLFGAQGHPIRATVAEMGPLLLARMLELNDTQEGVLNIAFKLADERGLLLLDFKDLTAMLQLVAENAVQLTTAYGNVSKATIGTIQRRLLTLEQQGAEQFFGEPALQLGDLMLTTPDGRGAVNLLAADKLIHSPRLYATFLLWLLSDLFEALPEAGDLPKPKLVFFFDEAHLLFNDAPKALTDKVEQVVRLIRSKGVGVYFVTQNPADVPPVILSQLGNRVQHALRAFTPAEQKGSN